MSLIKYFDRQEGGDRQALRLEVIRLLLNHGGIGIESSGLISDAKAIESYILGLDIDVSAVASGEEMGNGKEIKTAGVSKGSYIYVDGFRIQLLEDTAIELDQEVVDRFLKEESDRWCTIVWKNKKCCPKHPYGKP